MTHKITSQLNQAQQTFNLKKYKKTLQYTSRILKLNPTSYQALTLQARALHKLKRFKYSIPALEKISILYPKASTATVLLFNHYVEHKQWGNLSDLVQKKLLHPEHVENFILAFTHSHALCDWESIDKFQEQYIAIMQEKPENPSIFYNSLFSTITLSNFTEGNIFKIHRSIAQNLMDAAKNKQYTSYKKTTKRLKIAYLSSDLYCHPVGIFIQHCVANHNREHFEIYCYASLSNVSNDDELAHVFRKISDHYFDITHQTADHIAKQIHNDGIDILIDLGGYSGTLLLDVFAYKPAPVQISYCGYPYSTGLSTIDYRITDSYAEGNIKNYTEELLYMPESFLCMGGGYAKHPNSSPAPCEKNSYITFGSFNDLRKLNIPVIQLWSKVLHATPNSKILFRNRKVEGIFAQRLSEQFEKCDIHQDRLIFINGDLSQEEHCLYYSKVDIVLDVFPFCGATTSLETLWYNVPIITLVGETHRQRTTYSMLKNIGFSEGIAFTEEEYIEKATNMANQKPQALTTVRHCLFTLTRASILFQPEVFTHQLDQLYIEAWNKKMDDHRHIDKKPPAYSYHFSLKKSSDSDKIDILSDTAVSLTIHDHIQIMLPNTIQSLTTYVIAEQKDWFESEIQFIKKFIQPNMQALDIGASYGIYSLTIAKLLENSGYTWAFEPHKNSFEYLTKSIAANNFTNISPINIALSNKIGVADFYLNTMTETNAFQAKFDTVAVQKDTPIDTLDNYLNQSQWRGIDFVKIDTTGEDFNILLGGQDFFKASSPLVMFAYTANDSNLQKVISAFQTLHYQVYYLIPSLQILTPFKSDDSHDAFLLNLFYCKQDRAKTLHKRGLLAFSLISEAIEVTEQKWGSYLSLFPYSSTHTDAWKNIHSSNALPEWETYQNCLNAYITSQSSKLAPEQRISLLNHAFTTLISLLDAYITIPRLLTLIRITIDLGQHEAAIQLLQNVIENLYETNLFNPNEPFLAMSKEAEQQNFDDNPFKWCLEYSTSEKELQSSVSSFFSNDNTLELLQVLDESSLPHTAISRRYKLMKQRWQSQ